ncbi:phage antirepressor KilAC domain-containing protein [Rhodococcus rhodochrous]|uniref:phage antirepressor n=1 Tax=Rhodococcus rhodochrous TaxID=1829 RepID=UPI001E488845|nr:phage antirepressor KilAC domain-containing protein [Rhodococcus rhodochrous]MCB8909008.1 phage antirepressor KilAC domain-containing protein [Rhodococcus rhodochrous]
MSIANLTGEVVPFAYGAMTIRTITIDGEPWFVASDALDLLELYRSSLTSLDEDEKGVHTLDTPGGPQSFGIISESGLYSLILRSRKPEAKAIKKWITSEVLPSIRKTGSYGTVPALTGPELLAHAVIEAQQMLAAKDERIAQLEPKADFYDELMDADGTYSFAAVARILGWGRNVMMRELRRLGVLQPNNLPYRRYDHHFKVTPGTYTNRKTGETVPTATTSVRPSGLEFLRKKLTSASVQLEREGTNA